MFRRWPELARALRRSVGVAACGLIGSCSIAAPPALVTPATASTAVAGFELRQVASGVYLHAGEIAEWADAGAADVANIGVVVGESCVAVIDSGGSPAVGRRLRDEIARLTRLPVCFVINSHAHPDHLLGNSAFVGSGPHGADPQLIAHHRLAAALAARQRGFLRSLQSDIDTAGTDTAFVYPTRVVEQSLEIDLGGRTLHLTAWPTAHTDNDLSVFDPSTRTLFLGDLWFRSHLPVVDGSLRGWLKVMDDLQRIDATLAIPGHGPASTDWPGAMAAQRNYLQALLADTRAALKSRQTIREAVAGIAVDAAAAWRLTGQYHRRNVTAAFAELEWED